MDSGNGNVPIFCQNLTRQEHAGKEGPSDLPLEEGHPINTREK